MSADDMGLDAASDECSKSTKKLAQKCPIVTSMLDVAEEEVTDIGPGSSSETESSSGQSGEECCASKQCRFGKSSLETVPATPSAALPSFGSPPGFSRAAMREARDAYKQIRNPVSTARFGETPFGTEPKTPSGGAKLKALAKAFGSPPGLSRAELRRARDSCKGPSLLPTAWGSPAATVDAEVDEVVLTLDLTAAISGRTHSARDRLSKVKKEASLLKELKSSDSLTKEKVSTSNACEPCTSDLHSCRFGSSSLGTIPSTPVESQMSLASPPGLSRRAMRQARDACKGGLRTSESILTISPFGKPMTPPDAQEARKLGRSSVSASLPSLPRAIQAPR